MCQVHTWFVCGCLHASVLTYVWLSGRFAARSRYLFATAAHWLRTLTLSAPRHSPGCTPSHTPPTPPLSQCHRYIQTVKVLHLNQPRLRQQACNDSYIPITITAIYINESRLLQVTFNEEEFNLLDLKQLAS